MRVKRVRYPRFFAFVKNCRQGLIPKQTVYGNVEYFSDAGQELNVGTALGVFPF